MPTYKKTTATVISTQLGNAIGGGGQVKFHPIVTYRYTVNGQDYMNNRFSQRFVGYGRGSAQKMLNRHPIDSQIEIFYNVDDPAESFVQKGFGTGANLMIIFTFLIVIAVVLAIFYFGQGQGVAGF